MVREFYCSYQGTPGKVSELNQYNSYFTFVHIQVVVVKPCEALIDLRASHQDSELPHKALDLFLTFQRSVWPLCYNILNICLSVVFILYFGIGH